MGIKGEGDNTRIAGQGGGSDGQGVDGECGSSVFASGFGAHEGNSVLSLLSLRELRVSHVFIVEMQASSWLSGGFWVGLVVM